MIVVMSRVMKKIVIFFDSIGAFFIFGMVMSYLGYKQRNMEYAFEWITPTFVASVFGAMLLIQMFRR